MAYEKLLLQLRQTEMRVNIGSCITNVSSTVSRGQTREYKELLGK